MKKSRRQKEYSTSSSRKRWASKTNRFFICMAGESIKSERAVKRNLLRYFSFPICITKKNSSTFGGLNQNPIIKMKSIHYLMLSAGILAMVSCGPSKEEQERAEKAKQDSIAAVQKMADDSIAAAQKAQADAAVAAEKMKQDSIATADSLAKAKKAPAHAKKKEEPKKEENKINKNDGADKSQLNINKSSPHLKK